MECGGWGELDVLEPRLIGFEWMMRKINFTALKIKNQTNGKKNFDTCFVGPSPGKFFCALYQMGKFYHERI